MRDLTDLLSVKEFYVSLVILLAISWYNKNVLRLDCYHYDVFPSRVHGYRTTPPEDPVELREREISMAADHGWQVDKITSGPEV